MLHIRGNFATFAEIAGDSFAVLCEAANRQRARNLKRARDQRYRERKARDKALTLVFSDGKIVRPIK